MAILARNLMRTDLVTVGPALPALELGRELDRHRISGAPVVDGGRLVGVVSRADLSRALSAAADAAEATLDYYREVASALPAGGEAARLAGERVEALRVSDLMSRELVTVPADHPLRGIARALAEHRIHRVLVVDGGRLLGVISSLDLVGLVAEGRLEEPRR